MAQGNKRCWASHMIEIHFVYVVCLGLFVIGPNKLLGFSF